MLTLEEIRKFFIMERDHETPRDGYGHYNSLADLAAHVARVEAKVDGETKETNAAIANVSVSLGKLHRDLWHHVHQAIGELPDHEIGLPAPSARRDVAQKQVGCPFCGADGDKIDMNLNNSHNR